LPGQVTETQRESPIAAQAIPVKPGAYRSIGRGRFSMGRRGLGERGERPEGARPDPHPVIAITNSGALAPRAAPDPHEPDALAALVDHARATRDWVRLALLQARRFARADAGERAAIALELAEIERASWPTRRRARVDRARRRGRPETTAFYTAHRGARARGRRRALLERSSA
jgi:hypothetical protein